MTDVSPPSLIDRFIPSPALREVDRRAVAASPERAYAALRAIDLGRLRFVRLLFGLRTLPERLVGRLRGNRTPPPDTSRIDDIVRPGSGFLLLGEEPGREVVVGSVGKFWRPKIQFAQVTPDEFTGFARPDFGKLAWSLRVDPREGGGSWLTIDLRVAGTDAAAVARFRRYWRAIGPFSHAIRLALLRLAERELGPVSEDATTLAGDEFLAAARFRRTHAITIEAPPERVWPWLVQMGCRRGGWYSFDFLDNGGVPSAEAIVPRFQQISVGDILPARPEGPEGFAVLRIASERNLVLGSPSLLPKGGPCWGVPWESTWAFVLEPIGGAATRLWVRIRAAYRPGPQTSLVRPLVAAIHEVMQRRQLHNLRLRAESPAS